MLYRQLPYARRDPLAQPAETISVFNDAPWTSRAACLDFPDPDLFFPEAESDRVAQAWLPICNACPVRDLCLQHGLTHREKLGVWGGKFFTNSGRPEVAGRKISTDRKPMGRQHRLTRIDPDARRAACTLCGEVDVVWLNSKKIWQCQNGHRHHAEMKALLRIQRKIERRNG